MTKADAPLDQEAREAIATRLEENLFVEAGAGTGKTTALVRRMVALVLDRSVAVESIVAITFTDRAAAELRDRFRRALEEAARTEADNGRRSLAEAGLVDIDMASLSTLHGFARRLLAEHPLEVGLPPTFDLLDEVGSRLAFEDRWIDLQNQLLADPTLATTLMLAADLGIGMAHLRRLARILDDRWDLLDPAPSAPPDPVVETGPLIAALGALVDMRLESPPAEDKLQAALDAVAHLRMELAAIDDDLARLEFLLDGPRFSTLKFGQPGSVNVWGEAKELAIEAKKDAMVAWEAIVHGVAGQVLRRLVHELVASTRQAAADRRVVGALTYHDLLVTARDLLIGEPSGALVRAALHDRYRHLLLDEFQDTDPVQLDLALLIADAVTAHGSALDQFAPTDGALFMVGDPKQSIYRFRRADITLYLDVQRSLAAVPITLSENFRTTTPILDWINAVFERLIRPDTGQPHYVPLTGRRRPAAAGPPVIVLGRTAHGESSADELRYLEAEDVAATITSALADRWQVEDDGRERDCRFSDIAVLLPSRTSLSILEEALETAGIPYRAESSSLLFATAEVRDLLMVLRAIDDPTNDLAVVNALRTPYLGCGDDDLARWRSGHGGSWNHQAEPPSDAPADHPVGTGLAWLGDLHRQRHHLGPSGILNRLVVERRVLELAGATVRPREVWRRVRLLADRARAFTEAGGGSLRAFVDWCLQQAEDDSRVHETLLPELDDDAVRILTIHAAKGLEFPVVIVSGLTAERRGGRSGVDILFPQDGQPEVKVSGDRTTDGYRTASRNDHQQDLAERLRLLYVATTRARDHLVVSIHRSGDHDPGEPPEAAPTPAARMAAALAACGPDAPDYSDLVPTDRPLPRAMPPTTEHLPDRSTWAEERRIALVEAARPGTLAATRIAAHAAPDVLADRARPGEAGRHGTAIGRAVHGTLEHMPFDGGDPATLAREHATNEGVAKDAPLVEALVHAALASDVVRAAAESRHWRELYVAAPLGDDIHTLVEGFVDLAYLQEGPDGPGLVIVDYKTDAVLDDDDRVAKAARYRLQGATYALAAERATGLAVRRVVFCFLAEDGAVELDITDLPVAVAEAEATAREVAGA